MWVLISAVAVIWLLSFGWFNRAWEHRYCGKNKFRIFVFTPFMIPLYAFYALLQAANSKMCTTISFRWKRKICKWKNRSDLYDWICFFLPLNRVQFFDSCLRQFYYDTDRSWSDSIAHKISNFITNLFRCNPISWWANVCGQRLIVCVYGSKYLFTDWCRLRGEKSNVYFTYSTVFGRLKITKIEYFDEQTNEGVNLFMNSLFGGCKVRKQETVLFKSFVFTRKQALKAFKTLIEKYPEFWNPSCILKYENLYYELGEAEAWLENRDVSSWMRDKFGDGFVFTILVMLATNSILDEDLMFKRTKLAFLLEDNHRPVNKKKILSAIKDFRAELLKYEDGKFEMVWERVFERY